MINKTEQKTIKIKVFFAVFIAVLLASFIAVPLYTNAHTPTNDACLERVSVLEREMIEESRRFLGILITLLGMLEDESVGGESPADDGSDRQSTATTGKNMLASV